ncbi:MFS transporter [Paenibacillus sp. FSL W8-1187]|uniref:Putative integral membrane transport protein n=1 Tax=Paenibacillus pasadenensis TaxID=217090 RepID=A0A2N5N2Y5_9BACL|nr:MFS transporter [Paenibacillus pasadenensis]PLT44694.1 putative integral membrane transport protein [Paenibacillus pasadenensis]
MSGRFGSPLARAGGLIRRYDAALWIRICGNAVTATTTFLIRPFLALYLYEQSGGSLLLAMLVIGLQPFASMATSFLAGGVSDRLGRRPVMLGALLLQAACMGAYAFAEQVWAFAAITAVMGVGSALFNPAANAMVADVVPSERQREVFALLHTASNVGAAFGPAAGLLLLRAGENVVFAAGALLLLAYLFLVLSKVPETRPGTPRRPAGARGADAEEPGTAGGAAAEASRPAAPDAAAPDAAARRRALLGLTSLAMPIGLIFALVISILPFHFGESFARPEDVLASLMTFNGILVIALQLWIIARTKRLSASLAAAVSYGMFAAVSVGYAFSTVLLLLFVVELVFSVAEMLIGPHLQNTVAELAPEQERGWYFAIFGLHMHVPLALGPALGGLLYAATDGAVLFSALGALFVACGILQSLLIRRIRRGFFSAARPAAGPAAQGASA